MRFPDGKDRPIRPLWVPLSALLGLLLLVTGCIGERGTQSGGDLVRFVEPDGWWSLSVPRGWASYRHELDGTLRRVTSRQGTQTARPSHSPSPLWDPLATEVVYVFAPGDSAVDCSFPCPSDAPPSVTVVARELTHDPTGAPQPATDADVSQGSGAPIDTPCPADLRCKSVAITHGGRRTVVVSFAVEAQRRVYQIKLAAGIDIWARQQLTLERVVSSFRPIRATDSAFGE